MQRLFALCTLLAAFASPALAAPGQLDTTFGDNGVLRTLIPGPTQDIAVALATLGDGRILVAGASLDTIEGVMVLIRLNADGSRDASFPTVRYGDINVIAMTVQSDGRIVVVGTAQVGSAYAFGVLRFNADGTLDTTFNGSGAVKTPLGTAVAAATAVALQPDGKIVVAGYAYLGARGGYDFVVVRYNANGSLDTTFSGNGQADFDFTGANDRPTGVAVQSDGRIVVVGTTEDPLPTGTRFAAVRFEANGTLDTTFNGSGSNAFTIFGDGLDVPGPVAIQPNGRIVIAGAARLASPLGHYAAVARLTTAGVLDTTFSGNGKQATLLSQGQGRGKGLSIDPQGRIVVAASASGGVDTPYQTALVRYHANGDPDLTFGDGGVMLFGEGQTSGTSEGFAVHGTSFLVTQTFQELGDYDMTVMRRLASGQLDTAFGDAGTSRVNVGSSRRSGKWARIGVLAGGDIAVAGRVNMQGKNRYVATRYAPDGTSDAQYGTAGIALPSLGSIDSVVDGGVAIRADGTVAFTGVQYTGASRSFGTIKLTPEGKLDTSFSGDGRASTTVGSDPDSRTAAAVLPDGSIVVAVPARNVTPEDTFVVIKYRPDGLLDQYFGDDGIQVLTGFSDQALSRVVAIQPDGKILVGGTVKVGSFRFLAIVRLLPDGTPDTTFSGNGYLTSALSAHDHVITAMVVQDDGKILVGGGLDNGTIGYDFFVARYTAAGALDSTFNGNGRIVTVFGTNESTVDGLAIQADGRIVAAGISQLGVINTNLALARYNTNGTLDASFGTAGQSVVSIPGSYLAVSGVAIAHDGGILVAGGAGDPLSEPAIIRIQADATPAAVTFATQLNAPVSSTRTSNSVTVSGVSGSVPISIADGSYSIGCTSTFTTLPGIIANGSAVCVRHQASLFPGGAVLTTLYLGGRTATFTSIAAKAASVTMIASSVNPAPVQMPVTFTATVSGFFAVPSGVVTFRDGALVLGTAPVNPSGKAAFTATALALGSHAITATFGGDEAYNTSASTALSQVVAGNVLAVSAVTSNASVPYGTTVTFTATLSIAPPPSAIVFFYANGNYLGADTAAGTTATLATRSLPAGTHAITAEFTGSGSYAASTSPAVTQTVVPTASSTVLASDAAPGNLGSPITFTAVVASAGEAVFGSVAFLRGGVALPGCGTVPVLPNASAKCVISNLPVGSTTLVAQYSGDGSNLASNSNPLVQSVTYDPNADADHDGIPNGVEFAELRDPLVKDNELFTSSRWFAMQQYRDFLGREGEPGGVTFYTNHLDAGTLVRANVVENFFGSPEFQGLGSPIVRLYFATFLRTPDYGGLTFQMAIYRSGASLAAIANNFTLSAEFQSRYGTLNNAQFVTLLYNNILGRMPVQAEIDFHVARLAGGLTRGEVLIGFSESPEYRASIANDVYVTMMYVGMLRREPDPRGLIFWLEYMDAGNSGLALIMGFLNSMEYHDRFLPAQ